MSGEIDFGLDYSQDRSTVFYELFENHKNDIYPGIATDSGYYLIRFGEVFFDWTSGSDDALPKNKLLTQAQVDYLQDALNRDEIANPDVVQQAISEFERNPLKLISSHSLPNKKEVGNKGFKLCLKKNKHISTGKFAIIPFDIARNLTDYTAQQFEEYVKDVLGDGLYSVRSSGYHSLPGQTATYLNVEPKDIWKAARKVWASTKSKEVQFLLDLNGIDEYIGGIVIHKIVDVSKGGSGVVRVKLGDEDSKWTWTPDLEIQGEIVFGKFGTEIVDGKSNDTQHINDLPEYFFDSLKNELDRLLRYVSNWEPQEVEIAWDDDKLYVVQSRFWEVPEELNLESIEGATFNSGKPVYPGLINGTVVKYGDDLKDVKNPIYVAKDTVAKDVAYIVQSKAVVTDTGGALSHAAAIAQRFKIPCAVGFNSNIHNKLESGQRVLVNTERGEIKILNL